LRWISFMSPPQVTLASPLGPDLLFQRMTDDSGLSLLGRTDLVLLSEKPDLQPEALLGQPVTVSVRLREGQRFFTGHVTRFALAGHRGRFFEYRAVVRPWLWLLTRTADCRIFQEESVPDIVKKVFQDHGVAQFEFKLFRSYRKRTYCVQYRESDYQFVARLLEEEGIYWYFQHGDGSHKLVLVDAAAVHSPAAGCDPLPFFANTAEAPPDTEHVTAWTSSTGIKTGKTVLTSYDFERPRARLLADDAEVRGHELADYENFDFQGNYLQADDGRQLADTWLDELQTRRQRLGGLSNAFGLACGELFRLERHPCDALNAEYLCTRAKVVAQADGYEAGAEPGSWQCEFEAIPSAQQYRPVREIVKPFVKGPQTAVVVGPAGEEIHTDKYGRVKVQFHWDRYGKRDDRSSCWVRVSSPWAGNSFGFIQVPRIGQEVVVDFLEGDPDQPLITGRVYNADQMPPWELPANATQSGVLTRSSKGGAYGNANAIRFEDKQGAEQLWIHAEKNQDIEVENDETHWVGHDRKKNVDHDETTHVKHDRTETVDNNETITIGVDRTEKVGSNETISIGANRTEDVGVNETITIGANRTESVGANETVTVTGNRSVTVNASETKHVTLQRTRTVGVNETIGIGGAQEIGIGGLQAVVVGLAQTVNVGLSRGINVGMNLSTNVARDESRGVGGQRETSVGKDDTLKVGKDLVINAGDSITIKTGEASITMKKDGTIVIKGKDLQIDKSGKINMKATGKVVVKGSKILNN
jgi:type VI secretion system secreted protein VgrG